MIHWINANSSVYIGTFYAFISRTQRFYLNETWRWKKEHINFETIQLCIWKILIYFVSGIRSKSPGILAHTPTSKLFSWMSHQQLLFMRHFCGLKIHTQINSKYEQNNLRVLRWCRLLFCTSVNKQCPFVGKSFNQMRWHPFLLADF